MMGDSCLKRKRFFSPYILMLVLSLAVSNVIGSSNNLNTSEFPMNRSQIIQSIYAIQSNVIEIHVSIAFYEKLAFQLITKDHLPRVAPMLNSSTLLVLHRVERMTPSDPNDARTTLNMVVQNLDSLLCQLEKGGVKIVYEEPQQAAIGIWNGVRDPSGNIINLIERVDDVGDLSQPRVQNVSIIGTDIDRAVQFYSGVLGMEILTKDYDPVIPLRTEGVISNIALHGIAETNADVVYPGGTQTFLVFQVNDLQSVMERLKGQGVVFLHDSPQQAAPGEYAAFQDPFGLVHELLELK